jgi:hypothetical protein
MFRSRCEFAWSNLQSVEELERRRHVKNESAKPVQAFLLGSTRTAGLHPRFFQAFGNKAGIARGLLKREKIDEGKCIPPKHSIALPWLLLF